MPASDGYVSHSAIPGTDEFIERCERARTHNYVTRARAVAELPVPPRRAGHVTFGNAEVWFIGDYARVHLLDEASLERLVAIESWLAERKLEPRFDVLPTAPYHPVALVLAERGYRVTDFQPMLHRNLLALPARAEQAVLTEEVDGERQAGFLDTFLRGSGTASEDLERWSVELPARWRAERAYKFLAFVEGKPAAAATLVMNDRVARLANCATVPELRGRGAQTALISARLHRAADLGAELAIADARNQSLRNLARAGFRVCAQITQWTKPAPKAP